VTLVGLPRPVTIQCLFDERMETGGMWWEGGEALARWMAMYDGAGRVPRMSDVGSILELGAGTGDINPLPAVLMYT
jgi:hypothetical protein